VTDREPIRIVLGRGIANHPGFLDLVLAADLGRPKRVWVHHRERPASFPLHHGRGEMTRFLEERPSDTSEAYAQVCLQACREVGADVFWPGRELEQLSRQSAAFAAAGVSLLGCGTPETLALLDDKLAFAAAAVDAGVPSPRSIPFEDLAGFDAAWQELSAPGERVCFKPRRGIFGQGFRVVREDLDIFEDLFHDPGYRIDLVDARRRFAQRSRFRPMIAMPWLSGREVSVDCFRSRDGHTFVGVVRTKLNANLQELAADPSVVSSSRRLAEAFDLHGLFNCQFKRHRDLDHALEINARPAGGVGLTALAGLNLAELALRDALGLPLPAIPTIQPVRATLNQSWRPVTEREGGPQVPSQERVLSASLPTAEVRLVQEGDGWSVSDLVSLAARVGARRPFLLVSKVLGKHLPVAPATIAATHDALARQLPHDLPGPVVFVGMGETATGLGWGVHARWRGLSARRDTLYLHSTRYLMPGIKSLAFEEVHSHAPGQALCLPRDPELARLFSEARTLVVVDDELTSGRTAAALAEAVASAGVPLARRIAVVLLDASAEASGPKAGLGLETRPAGTLSGWDVASLARVNLWCEDRPTARPASVLNQRTVELEQRMGALGWGRIGAGEAPELSSCLLEGVLRRLEGATEATCIGFGECMHPAFLLGRALEARGLNVRVQATTRSPIALGGPIAFSLDCRDGLGSGVPFFLHNPPSPGPGNIVLHEPGGQAAAAELAARLGGFALEVWDA
jgi:hypothetical protein